MRVSPTALILGAVLAAPLVSLTACSSTGRPAPEPPDFSGTWVLNFDESEDLRAQMQRERPPGPGDRPSARPGVRPRVNPEEMHTRMRAILQGQLAFKLIQTDSTVTFAGAEGAQLVYRTDGRWEGQSVEGLGDIRVRARWKGEKLVLDRELENGLKVSQTYELEPEGGQLHVKVKISGGPRTIEFRRVYDAHGQGG